MSKANYSHLLSSVAAVKAREVEGEKNAERLEDEKPPANDEPDNKKSKKAKSKAKAEDESKEREEGEEDEKKEDSEEESETEKEDREDKKSKGAKKASAESSDVIMAARLEERLRCAQIFQSKAAAGRPQVAAQFAFHTDLSADSAIAIMDTLPVETKPEASAPKRVSIDERMASAPRANVGLDAEDAPKVEAKGVSMEDLTKMDPAQKALMIVNAGRTLRGEAPLLKLN